jgi:hypothetical protein
MGYHVQTKIHAQCDVLSGESAQRSKHHRSATCGCNPADIVYFALAVPIVGELGPERPTHLAIAIQFL